MATMKEIAQICGVSRGTVDRVINRRGKVRPETERMILQAVERMGYTKSMLGRALSVKRSQPVIGVVMCSEGNPFFDDVYAGLARAEEELLPYGVTVERRAMRGYDVDRQLALIDELAPSLSALVLQPVNDPRVEERVQQLKARGVPTVTVNTDLPASSRCCYVGSDYESGGATAAALLELMTQARGRVGVVAGVPTQAAGAVLRAARRGRGKQPGRPRTRLCRHARHAAQPPRNRRHVCGYGGVRGGVPRPHQRGPRRGDPRGGVRRRARHP